MKAHLKTNIAFVNILSAGGCITLRLSIEILNYFDTVASK